MSRNLSFLYKICNFLQGFLKFLSIFDICPFSSARKPIPRSDKSYCMVVFCNGFVINNLAFRILEIFLINFAIFFNFFKTFVLYSGFFASLAS